MEVSGVVLGKIPCVSISDGRYSGLRSVSGFSGKTRMVGFRIRKFRGIRCNNEFTDKGHMKYYFEPIRCGGDKEKVKVMEKEKKAKKKKAKVLKSLSKNLNMFSSIGFGLDPEAGLIAEIQNKTISEATEILAKQLEQLKAEEKLMKKQRKEEKAKAKAMKMNTDMDSESSSSSESSDSDCDKSKVVNMSSFRNSLEPLQPKSPVATLPRTQDSLLPKNLEDNTHSCKNTGELLQLALLQAAAPYPSMANPGSTLKTTEADSVVGSPLKRIEDALLHKNLEDDAHKNTAEALHLAILQAAPASTANPRQTSKIADSVVGLPSKRIEVCMGGKCKKSGGALLLNEFQRAMTGLEGTAVACKCMGKCRDGPNVRVMNETDTAMTDSVRTPSKTVCLGVGLQDVEAIVTSFFGEEL